MHYTYLVRVLFVHVTKNCAALLGTKPLDINQRNDITDTIITKAMGYILTATLINATNSNTTKESIPSDSGSVDIGLIPPPTLL